MKKLLLLSIIFSLPLAAKDIIYPFDAKNANISVKEKENWVYVSLEAQALIGQRLIYAWPKTFTGQKEVYLDYYFIMNYTNTLRSSEPVTVTWKIMRLDWDKWKKEKKLFIRKKDDIKLSKEQIETIKKTWKL